MNQVSYQKEADKLIIQITGIVDSSNSPAIEEQIQTIVEKEQADRIVMDFSDLEYITSAGLRIILRLKQDIDDTSVINVSSEIYEILDMTGFTEMMDISKAYRKFSVEGCEVIGQGANGKVYRIDRDTIVKVYMNPDSLPEIHRERELARTAFILGVPTAIPYDVVKIEGGGYGSVYELLDASNLADELASGRKTMDEVVQLEVELLKTIHSTEVNPDLIPPFTEKAMKWLEYDKDHLPADKYEKLCSLVQSIPDDNHLIHGDFHMKNIMYQNGECLLIDMDSLSHGNTVYELVTIWCSYVGLGEIDNTIVENFLGIPYQDAVKIWKMTVASFFETDDQAKIKEIEDKVRILGYARIIRRCVRKNRIANETGKKEYENAVSNICSLLDHVDSLVL